MEQLHSIIYMLFVATIIIFDIVIISHFMQDIDVRLNMQTSGLQFNTVAARLIYSPDCFAWEESYWLGDTLRHQVHPGTIDLHNHDEDPSTIDKNDIDDRTASCINGDILSKLGWRYFKLEDFPKTAFKEYKPGICSSNARLENFLVMALVDRGSGGELEKGVFQVCT